MSGNVQVASGSDELGGPVTGRVSSDFSPLTPLWAGMAESCQVGSVSLGRRSGRGGLTDSLGQTLGWIAKAIA